MTKKYVSYGNSYRGGSGLAEWRSRALLVLISFAFLALLVRGFWVQVLNSKFYIERGQARYERLALTHIRRAKILDRNGSVLAISEPVYDLWVDPKQFSGASQDQVKRLAKSLSLSATQVGGYRESSGRFVYVKRLVDMRTALPLLASGIPGLHGQLDEKRYFPEGELAAQVVGLAGREGRGVEGIELAANKRLGGVVEKRVVVVDRLGRVIDDPDYRDTPSMSENLSLSIDRNIQRLAFDALKRGMVRTAAKSGCAIVLDSATGEILALVNAPTFDPNDRNSSRDLPARNRALTDAFEPGSTIKPVVVALALDRGFIRENTLFDTAPGVLRFHGAMIHDTSNHGVISTTDVIAKSSNIGMVKISELLSSSDMWQNFRSFGLGAPPLEGFPGVTSGVLHAPGHWHALEQGTMAYGYGLSVSLVQLAGAYQILANNGVRVPLSLYRDSVQKAPELRVISEVTAKSIQKMLEATVMPGGTATMARLADYRVGAKTGTARKSDGEGYASGRYMGMMVGMAPMSAPRIVVAVVIDTPTKGSIYGGPVAGPIFGEILGATLSYLKVLPDRRDRGALPRSIVTAGRRLKGGHG